MINNNSKCNEKLSFSGERFTPEVEGQIAIEHLHRYALACELAAGKTVLDIACGEGYGSAMLSGKAKKVIGIDISIEAVKHAAKRYQNSNIEFKIGNCSKIPLSNASADLVVSFETIEHHDQHGQMMQEIKRVLRPGGVLLISSPDKYFYSEQNGYNNPYHVKELYEKDFKQLINIYFKKSIFFGQRMLYGSAIFAETQSNQSKVYHQNKESLIENVLGMPAPIYWLGVASDEEIPTLPSSIFESPVSQSEPVINVVNQYNSTMAQLSETTEKLNSTMAQLSETLQSRTWRWGNKIVGLISLLTPKNNLKMRLAKKLFGK